MTRLSRSLRRLVTLSISSAESAALVKSSVGIQSPNGSKTATRPTVGKDTLHSGGINCTRFSPDGMRFATGSEDGTIRLWQTGSVRYLGTLTATARGEGVRRIEFFPDGHRIASTATDNTLKIWSWPDALGSPRLDGDRRPRRAGIEFSNDGKLLAFVHREGEGRVREASTEIELARFSANGVDLAICPTATHSPWD